MGVNLSMGNEAAHSPEHGETCLLRPRVFWPAQKGLFWRWGGTRPRMGILVWLLVRHVYQSSRVMLLKTGSYTGMEFPGWEGDGVCPPAP